MVHEAATNGNYAPLAAQAEMIGDELERMIAMGMHHSVVCAEDAPRFAGAVDRKALEATAIGPLMLDGMQAICEVWPRGPVDADFAEPLDSAVPALLLSGEFDPATPADLRRDGRRRDSASAPARRRPGPGPRPGAAALPAEDAAAVHRRRQRRRTSTRACVEQIRPAPFFLSFSGSAP